MSVQNRAIASLVGLACGDAVGTTVEFKRRGEFDPLTDMIGGGPFNLKRGAWTDDTSMALCLGASLLHRRGFEAKDQMNRYCNWYKHAYMSSNGTCFDIRNTVRAALEKYLMSSNPFSGSDNPRAAGNGSLMRLAPIPMFYLGAPQKAVHYAGESSRTTHGAEECIDSCRYFCTVLMRAMLVSDKRGILTTNYVAQTQKVQELLSLKYLTKPYEKLTGSGYVIESLESALWCFYHGNSFKESVLLAANIGNDADTTAAICGQICGAFYGLDGIPTDWANSIALSTDIHTMAKELFLLGIELNGKIPLTLNSLTNLKEMKY